MRLPIVRPLHHRDFLLLFVGQTVSIAGNALYIVASNTHGDSSLQTFVPRQLLGGHRPRRPEPHVRLRRPGHIRLLGARNGSRKA